MDVYLHLGAHRTGSTAFQAFLRVNRARLATAGTAVWLPEDVRRGPLAALAARPGGAGARDRDLRLAWRLDAALDRLAASGARRLVLSDENLAGTMAACQAAAQPYPDCRARLLRIDALLGGRVAGAGLALRDPADWWRSVFAFRLPRGGPLPDADLLVRIAAQPRGWAEVVADIAAALPGRRVSVSAFPVLADRPGRMLAALTGSAPPEGLCPGPPARNAAPSPAQVQALLARRGLAGPQGAVPDGGWLPFRPEDLARLARRHAADLARIARLAREDGRIEFTGGPAATPASAGPRKEGPNHDRQDPSLADAGREGTA